MREGTRVVFQPTPESRAFYGYAVPPAGALGAVRLVALGGRCRTCLTGPGGGLVHVGWDDGTFCGVSRLDVRRLRRALGPGRRGP